MMTNANGADHSPSRKRVRVENDEDDESLAKRHKSGPPGEASDSPRKEPPAGTPPLKTTPDDKQAAFLKDPTDYRI